MPYTKEQRKEYNKKYRENNKEKINERNKDYREKNKEKFKEYDKKYREKNRTCKCGIIATFNYINEKALYCNSCKLDNMIDVKNKSCKCGKRPSYNYPNKKALYCSSCKLYNMIDVIHTSKRELLDAEVIHLDKTTLYSSSKHEMGAKKLHLLSRKSNKLNYMDHPKVETHIFP